MTYQKCPVCEGRGIVPCGFYYVPEGQTFTSSSTAPETCRTCQGKGIIVLETDTFIISDELREHFKNLGAGE